MEIIPETVSEAYNLGLESSCALVNSLLLFHLKYLALKWLLVTYCYTYRSVNHSSWIKEALADNTKIHNWPTYREEDLNEAFISYVFPQDSWIFMKEEVGRLQEQDIIDTFKETVFSEHKGKSAHTYASTFFCVW